MVLTHFFLEDGTDVAKAVVLVVKENGHLAHVKGVSDGLWLCSDVLEGWLGRVGQSAVLSDAAALGRVGASRDNTPSASVPRLLWKNGEGVELLVQLRPNFASVDGLVGTSRGGQHWCVCLQKFATGVSEAHVGASAVVVAFHVVDCA